VSRLAELELEERDGVQVARLTGELDLSNVADVADALTAAVSPEAAGLVVDMAGLRHIDSAGVRMLFDVRRRLAQHRQEVVLAVPERARIRDVLELTAVEMMLPVLEDLDAAVRAVRGHD
jgi:anti-sigma B factor antagonist